jgi:hypothetical protein
VEDPACEKSPEWAKKHSNCAQGWLQVEFAQDWAALCWLAGEWRGLAVAIKTVLFQSGAGDDQMARVASEAAIASNLVHRNIVSTYSHDICNVSSSQGNELAIYKFYLIQVLVLAVFWLFDCVCLPSDKSRQPGVRAQIRSFAGHLHGLARVTCQATWLGC